MYNHQTSVMIVLFWIAFMMPAYTYLIFPMILYVISRLHTRDFSSAKVSPPTVTLLISAYNEADVIRDKLINTLALNYPSDKLQIIVVNDGSTDQTDKIVAEFESSRLIQHRVEGRGGKNIALNKTRSMITGDIVVFSDANCLYDTDAILRLVEPFSDNRVGCVCGELRYINASTGTAVGESLYWRYEQCLKRWQSKMGEVLVLNGSIFAIRHEQFHELHAKIANDFQIPVDVSTDGFSIIYEPRAIAREKVAADAADELQRKARIIARGFEGFFSYFRHFHGIRLFQFVSQKFLRWNVWMALIAMLALNSMLVHLPFFKTLFVLQLLFYSMAAMGPLINRLKIPGLGIPYYFCLINFGAFLGFYRFISRKQTGHWEPPSSAR